MSGIDVLVAGDLDAVNRRRCLTKVAEAARTRDARWRPLTTEETALLDHLADLGVGQHHLDGDLPALAGAVVALRLAGLPVSFSLPVDAGSRPPSGYPPGVCA